MCAFDFTKKLKILNSLLVLLYYKSKLAYIQLKSLSMNEFDAVHLRIKNAEHFAALVLYMWFIIVVRRLLNYLVYVNDQ